ncbi:MAG: hypothetical protein ACTHMP_10130 [Thermomicrobiales bacterium]
MVDATKVIATRDFEGFTAPWASTNDMPADTVDYGAITTPYVGAGYTIGGLGFAVNVQRGEIRVDQEPDPISTPVNTRTITLDTNFAEITPDNINKAVGLGTTSTVAPTTGVRGHNDLAVGSGTDDQFLSALYEAKQQNGEAFRVLAYKGQATGNPNVRIVPNQPAQIAFQVGARVDTSTTPARMLLVREVLPAA